MGYYRKNDDILVPVIVGGICTLGFSVASLVCIPKTLNECELCDGYHAHKYLTHTNNGFLNSYKCDEKDNFDNKRLSEFIPLTVSDMNVINELDRTNLYDANLNMEYLENEIINNRDYLEYYYETTTFYIINGKPQYSTTSGWTTNVNHGNLTGRVRVVHTRYNGYKMFLNDELEYSFKASSYVDDPRTLLGEYDYISKYNTTQVYEEFRYKSSELKDIKVEDITPFYTPNIEDYKEKPKELIIRPNKNVE